MCGTGQVVMCSSVLMQCGMIMCQESDAHDTAKRCTSLFSVIVIVVIFSPQRCHPLPTRTTATPHMLLVTGLKQI